MKKLIYSLTIVLSLAACSKKNNPINNVVPDKDTTTTQTSVPVPYIIKENFEFGEKTAYAVANVDIKTGNWSFDDALIGLLDTDVKNNLQSVRLRAGKISMNFDIDSISSIKFSYAQYGNDAASQISLWVSSDKGVTYTQLGNTLAVNTKAFKTDSFKVDIHKKVRFQIRNLSTTRVNIDDIVFSGAGNPGITFNSVPDVDPVTPIDTIPEPGRDTPVGGSDVPPTTGDNSNLLFGNPSNALADVVMAENYLIDQKYYVESYSKSKGAPNWVSWHLDETSSTNATGRLDNFAPFSGLPTGFYQVQSTSLSRSGFDRGHNCPSADRTSSIDANSSTFLMTNMIAQAPNNNQKAWADLENYLRAEVQKGNEVYIIMGSYGKGGVGSKGYAETLDNGHITVPNRVWKVAVILTKGNNDLSRVDENTRVLAVDTPNDNSMNTDWKTYITTVDAIEAAASIDILSALPATIQIKVEAKIYKP